MSAYLSKLLAVTYLALGLWLSANHGLAPAVALLGFVVLAIGAYASETLWLAALPSILVLGSLYPWTGDLVFAEYDIGLCALLGGRLLGNAVKHFELPISEKSAYSRSISAKSMRADSVLTNKFSVQNASQRGLLGRSKQQLDFASLGPLWWLAALVTFIAGVRGWLSLPPALPGDQLSLYTTNTNAVQQTKVLFYAVALVPLLIGIFRVRSESLRISRGRELKRGS